MAESDLKSLLSDMPNFEIFSDRVEWLENLETTFRDDVRDHSEGVAYFAVQLAETVGFNEEDIVELHQAARWHDIGKLATPGAILRKAGKLDADERTIMNQHARDGLALLGADAPQVWKDVTLYHHERYDGVGYEGLKGEDIPFAARIVAIADVHDALIQKRVYKAGMPEESALLLMVANNDSPGFGRRAFDPALLRAFVAMRLNDPDLSASDESRLKLEQFSVSNPMNDIRGGVEKNGGWLVKHSGHRILYDLEGDTKRLMEMRGPDGKVEFQQPELRKQKEIEAPSVGMTL